MSIEIVLSRLDRVKQTGPDRYLACCPAHPDKSPSLSLRELDDGRTLIHCFAGCETAAILSALGLEFSDLYPPSPLGNVRPERRPFPALDVLKAVSFEATIVLCAARDMLDAGDLSLGVEGFARLKQAADRIESALSLAQGGLRHA